MTKTLSNCMIICTILCSSCYDNYVNDKYYIDNVKIRLVDFAGMEDGCAKILPFKKNRKCQYSGFAIKLEKLFFSDSTRRHVNPSIFLGKEGAADTILLFRIWQDSLELGAKVYGSTEKSYIKNELRDANVRCAPEPYDCNCLWTPTFMDLNDFIAHYNESATEVKFDNLSQEIFFWMKKKEWLANIRDTIEYELATNRERFLGAVSIGD